jgi:hypothetical protein
MVTIEQLAQLQTPQGERLLAEVRTLAPTAATAIAIASRLRKTYPADLVTAAMAMHDLRVSARSKFDRADDLWFTRDGLEQATSEPIARHRAGRYNGCTAIVDLCCGIGGDLLALAQANPKARLRAVDRDPLHLEIASLNAEVIGVAERVAFVEADVREVTLDPGEAAFIDPARRSERGRMARGESEPPLDWCIGLAGGGRAVGIKAAPGIDHDLVPPNWELETTALGFDLKEATLWSPALARAVRTATVIDGDGVHAFSPAPGPEPPLRTPEPGDTLLDPNPAITRAGLVADLARSLDAVMIDPQIAFLVTSAPVATPFARAYPVVASLPWHERELKRMLRELDAGPVDVRRRGLAGDVDAIAKRLRGSGDRPFTIAMTRVMGQPWAIVCDSARCDPR